MRKFILTLVSVFVVLNVCGQEKNVAVIAPFDYENKVELMYEKLIKSKLQEVIAEASNYNAFTRTDIDAIVDEQHFQQTGMVKEEEIKKIGEMTGATHICVSELTTADEYITIAGRIINIETAQVEREKSVFKKAEPEAINKGSIALANELVGKSADSDEKTDFSDFTKEADGAEIEMVAVEGGTYKMGCTREQSDCDDDETPVHTVTVDDFYISKYEITNEQYCEFLNSKGVNSNGNYGGKKYIDMDKDCQIEYSDGEFTPKSEKVDHPVINVTWYGAKAFCQHYGGRLPTEAEWEFAARGGNKANATSYAGSDNIDDVAWYRGNSGDHTHEVGTKSPNELGIYDMSGNVCEWCSDWYDSDYYSTSPQNNPQGPSFGSYRVQRGRSWLNIAENCQVANRSKYVPSSTYVNTDGFRFSQDK